jgi:dTDP-4-dehydrorhamnose reductase
MMRILLLGPNGQLGSDIRAAASSNSRDIEIVPVDRATVDLSDLDAATGVIRGFRFDALVNCTGYHKTDEVEGNAPLAFAINAHLVRRLADICAEKKARLVQVSTDYVYGGQNKRAPLSEEDGCAPVNVYGASKLMGEALALSSGADVLIARVASLFGVAGSSGKGGNFVETMIRFAKEKGRLSVVADQWMSPTATADIAEALLGLLAADAPKGVWHVVNSEAATWHQFAARIVERSGIEADVTAVDSSQFPTVAKRPPYSVLDNGKIAKALRPMRPWQDALDDYLVRKGHRPQ